MSRFPNLTRRYLAVFAIAAAATLSGQVLVQSARDRQAAHFRLIGEWARQRQLAERVAGAALLLAQRNIDETGRREARVSLQTAAQGLTSAGGLDPHRVRDDAPHRVADAVAARATAATPLRERLAADGIAMHRLTSADAGLPDGAPKLVALAARISADQRAFTASMADVGRDVLAASEVEMRALRREELGLAFGMLGMLALGALVIVRPATRHAERLLGEIVTSGERLARAHAATTREREFATSLVACSTDGIFAFDAEQRVTEWNPAMEQWTGVRRSVAMGRRLEEFEANIDWGDDRPYAGALLGEPTHVSGRPARATRDGAEVFFDASCVPLLASDGAIAGGLVSIRDVSERVANVARVTASEARLRALFDQAAVGITFIDDDGIIHDANPAFERLVGYSAHELRGRVAASLSPSEDAAITRGPVSELRSGARDSVTVEKRFVRSDGSTLWGSLTISRLGASGDRATMVGLVYDVTERKELETRLSHQAFHDPLTGLANRSRLRDRIELALAAPDRAPASVAIVYVDLDDFKKVNDSLGHAAGDALLRTVAERLLNATRGSDTVARLGGDEFAILLQNVRTDEDALVVAERVVRAMRAPVQIEGKEVFVGASVGIARGDADPEVATTAEVLLRNADVAMYRAKGAGKGRHTMYERGMQEAALERLELEAALRHAIDEEQLLLHFQPIVELEGERVVGVEALVRWQHPTLGLLAPARFIPLAEETGLIVPLGRWVLWEACRHGVRWISGRGADANRALTLTVNVSPRQLHDGAFVSDVAEVLAASGFPAEQLLLELTEGVFMQQDETTIDTLRALKALGVRLAIDDFGTGYSSLSYLQQFPLDVLKIDRRFVEGVGRGGTEAALARTIIALGDSLAVRTVAEGVARPHQQEQLRALGCAYGQGFLFAHPVAPEEITRLLEGAEVRSVEAA